MPRYEVQHDYVSGRFGPWMKGDQITLDEVEDAAHVNRDSPGTLVEIDPEAQARAKRERQRQIESEREAAGKPTLNLPSRSPRGR